MKAAALFLALLAIIALAFAARTNKVGSCYDDVKQESVCMKSWEDYVGDNDPSTPDNFCSWCVSKAVPSVCANSDQVQRLPPGVFICSNSTSIPKF